MEGSSSSNPGNSYPCPSHVTMKLSSQDTYDVWKTLMLCLLKSHGMLHFIQQETFNGIGASLNKHLRKEEVILRKQHCFRRVTGSCRRLYKTTASDESSYALKAKTSEVYPSSKTVAEHVQSTKRY
ncbi:hypothetical protein E3N88_09761 [Mikania micrantha]|uniref:Retrotransposon Copia-like N-terminal domain-containing protein n=1 Tax=Mikania micrantha TaxID=192012 RepID=A0A5N6PN19_9ASTR|nr:hypothetical protein E3N88_09761 [Mikania micrantha]